MENVAANQQSNSGTASKRPSDTLTCLVAYPISIFLLIKLVLTANAFAMETYANLGAALPPSTVLAAHVANALAYQTFYWVFGLGLVLGAIHAALRPWPAHRKRFALAVYGILLLATGLMLAGISLPLFQL